MAHLAHYKRCAVGNMTGHYERVFEERGFSRANIDPVRTPDNYEIGGGGMEEKGAAGQAFEAMKGRCHKAGTNAAQAGFVSGLCAVLRVDRDNVAQGKEDQRESFPLTAKKRGGKLSVLALETADLCGIGR